MKKGSIMVVGAIALAAAVSWAVWHGDSPSLSASGAQAPDSGAPLASDGQLAPGANSDTEAGKEVPPSAIPTASDATAPRANHQPAATTESRLLSPNGLRTEVVQNLIMSDGFGRVVDAMSRESDADSLQMAALFRGRLQGSLATDPAFALERIACGAQVCAAIVTASVQDEARFQTLAMANATGPKMYSIISHALPEANAAGRSEYRLVFTTDPKLNSIQVR